MEHTPDQDRYQLGKLYGGEHDGAGGECNCVLSDSGDNFFLYLCQSVGAPT
jgi:hypothetical protein